MGVRRGYPFDAVTHLLSESFHRQILIVLLKNDNESERDFFTRRPVGQVRWLVLSCCECCCFYVNMSLLSSVLLAQ